MSLLEAKKEWLERYGTYINQAKNWRLIAIFTSIAAIIMGIGFYTQAVRTHIVPYVVEINSTGSVQDIKLLKPLIQNNGLSPMTVRYYINQYIEYIFSNIGSREVTKERVAKIVGRSLPNPKAVAVNYLKKHNPFIEKHLRTVDIRYILQNPNGSYNVSYAVSEIADNGLAILTTNYIATIGIVVIPPKTLKKAEINPLGVYIKYFSFTKE